MLIRVTWVNGSETDLFVRSLRELDRFLGDHAQPGVVADLKPFGVWLRLVFKTCS